MNIIDQVLRRQEFVDRPPVFVDVGASGELHDAWRKIAKYSVCIAFDADDREMDYIVAESDIYKKLYIYKRVLTAGPESQVDFYLTKSPYCSSTLPADEKKLRQWAFSDLFIFEKTVKLKSTNLAKVLDELQLDRIDWFKTDSQGTDLRLFAGLDESIIHNVLVAEFEPGIIDAYQGEDKLWKLMSYMDSHDFWMTDIDIKGSQYITKDIFSKLSKTEKKYLPFLIKTAPGWGEVCYLNSFNVDHTLRDYLLGWVFAFIKRQYGFAYRLAAEGSEKYKDPIFQKLMDQALVRIRITYPKLLGCFLRRVARKLLNALEVRA